MAPSIGQAATLNGKPVRWSGENYGWQSPATHKQLEAQGKFHIGTQAIDRITQYLGNSQVAKAAVNAQRQFKQATDKLGFEHLDRALNAAIKADDTLPSSRVAQGGAILANNAANALKIDPRIALVGMLATGAGGKALPSKNRITDFDPTTGKGHAWLPATAKGNPYLRLPNGTQIRLDETRGGAWSKEPFQAMRQRDGSLVLEYPRAGEPIQVKPPAIQHPNLEMPSGGPRPFSQAEFNEPQGTRPQRIHVQGRGGSLRLSEGFNVRPEEMAPPRGDGNDYGRAARVAELPEGWVEGGSFITNADTARRHNRDKQRNQFLEGKATVKADPNLTIRDEVAWADGDVTKLNPILERLGGKPQRYASQAERAIERKLGAKENTYGGKPSLSKAERTQFTDDWDWKNLLGLDRPEAKRLSELATQKFGNRGITPEQQAQMASSSAAAQERIKGKLNFPKPNPSFKTPEPLDTQTRAGRPPSRSVRPPTPTSTKPTERAEQVVQRKDAALTQSATTRYQPKLSDEQREVARRARANRSLRSLTDRLPKPNQTAIDAILKLIRVGK